MHKERVFTLPSQGSKIQSVSVWVTLNMQVMARFFSDFDPAYILSYLERTLYALYAIMVKSPCCVGVKNWSQTTDLGTFVTMC
jgi:hypothetical protein